MNLVVACGLLFGIGLAGVIRASRPRRRNLDKVLLAMDGGGVPNSSPSTNLSGFTENPWTRSTLGSRSAPGSRSTLGSSLQDMIMPAGLLAQKTTFGGNLLAPALAMTGTTFESWWLQTVLIGAVGLLLPVAFDVLLEAGGAGIPVVVVLLLSLAFTTGGAALSYSSLAAEARRQRVQARKAISSYLDLVVLCLAGGMGIEGALHSAAEIGDHPTQARLAVALEQARDDGTPPWQALASLGEQLGIGELRELAASVGLAGTEGARIRASLVAKAASMRRHELAEVETAANVVTERLFLPGVLLLGGFLVFIAYPAFARIATGL